MVIKNGKIKVYFRDPSIAKSEGNCEEKKSYSYKSVHLIHCQRFLGNSK
jgi:cytolysin (calcineurin-like family phosphatase)